MPFKRNGWFYFQHFQDDEACENRGDIKLIQLYANYVQMNCVFVMLEMKGKGEKNANSNDLA